MVELKSSVVAFAVALSMVFVQGEAVGKQLWTLDRSQHLMEQRSLTARSFKSARVERMDDLSLFEFPMGFAASLSVGDKISFEVPASAKLKKRAVAARAAAPRSIGKSCELVAGIVGMPAEISPALKLFSCFPSEFEEFHLIINTEKENGIFATLFDEERNMFYIDPAYEDGETYVVYNTNSMKLGEDDVLNETVEHSNFEEAEHLLQRALDEEIQRPRKLQTVQDALRFRFALLVSPETSADHGGTIASVSSVLVAVMTRTNGILARELGVVLELINGFEAGICLNRDSGPCAEVVNNIGQRTKNAEALASLGIAGDQYDLAHFIHNSGGGGVASVDVVCNSDPVFKASGTSDFFDRVFKTPDAFVVNMFAHEVGHQLGAQHSWRDCGNFQNQFSASEGVEPGSGSTIMSYVGICAGSKNLQRQADPYFNNFGQQIMRTKIEKRVNTESNCGTVVPISGRTVPTITTPKSCTLPTNTKFLLKGNSNSGSGSNRFASWDRIDNGFEDVFNAKQGRFRSYKPGRARERFFPNLHFLNFGILATAENLPKSSETMKFRFTERRNYQTNAQLASFDRSVIGDFFSSDTDIKFESNGRLILQEPANKANIPTDEPFVVRWDPGKLSDFSPDKKIQILFAKNTMSPVSSGNLIDFDPETDLDALNWQVLIESDLTDGAACVTLPAISGNLANFDGNLMIKVSANDDRSATISDASNCFAFDISTGISVFKADTGAGRMNGRRRLESCQLGTTPAALGNGGSNGSGMGAGGTVVLVMFLLVLVALIGLAVYKKQQNEGSPKLFSSERFLGRGGKGQPAHKPRQELPPGGILARSSMRRSKKRSLSLTDEGFGKGVRKTKSGKNQGNPSSGFRIGKMLRNSGNSAGNEETEERSTLKQRLMKMNFGGSKPSAQPQPQTITPMANQRPMAVQTPYNSAQPANQAPPTQTSKRFTDTLSKSKASVVLAGSKLKRNASRMLEKKNSSATNDRVEPQNQQMAGEVNQGTSMSSTMKERFQQTRATMSSVGSSIAKVSKSTASKASNLRRKEKNEDAATSEVVSVEGPKLSAQAPPPSPSSSRTFGFGGFFDKSKQTGDSTPVRRQAPTPPVQQQHRPPQKKEEADNGKRPFSNGWKAPKFSLPASPAFTNPLAKTTGGSSRDNSTPKPPSVNSAQAPSGTTSNKFKSWMSPKTTPTPPAPTQPVKSTQKATPTPPAVGTTSNKFKSWMSPKTTPTPPAPTQPVKSTQRATPTPPAAGTTSNKFKSWMSPKTTPTPPAPAQPAASTSSNKFKSWMSPKMPPNSSSPPSSRPVQPAVQKSSSRSFAPKSPSPGTTPSWRSNINKKAAAPTASNSTGSRNAFGNNLKPIGNSGSSTRSAKKTPKKEEPQLTGFAAMRARFDKKDDHNGGAKQKSWDSKMQF